MSVTTFAGVVEDGQIKLAGDIRLPDHTDVYVVVPARPPVNLEMEKTTTDEPAYQYLESRPDKHARELFLRGRGIRASTIWHDRFVSQCAPERIAADRDLPLAAVYEALDYCQRHWETICAEKQQERQWLEQKGFFNTTAASGNENLSR